MNWSKTALSLIALSVILPSSAIADNVRVSTDNVRVTSSSNGDININTEKTSVSVPTRRHSTWYPWRYWRTPQRSNCQRSYQQTTQLSSSGKKVVHHSATSNYCR